MTRVYYNSACPICNAGIRYQRRRMEANGVTGIEWIDIHAAPDAAAEVDASLEAVRERLYVRTADGRLNIGADAFAALWSRTPGQRWLAAILRAPVLHPIARAGYNVFARCLYRWNRRRGRW